VYKKSRKIKIVISNLKEGRLLNHAIESAGMSRAQWWQWEKKLPRLKALRIRAQELCDDKRTRMVEDAFLKTMIKGKASPASYIFYLCNRASDRWKNDYKIEHSGEIKGDGKIIINIVDLKKEIEKKVNNSNRVNDLLLND